jgi:hypothetical protein
LAAEKPRQERVPLRKRAATYPLVPLALVLAGFFAITDSLPRTKERPAPTAQQAGAGRDAVLQFRSSIASSRDISDVRLRSDHLDGLSALATHGFRPDRIDLSVANQTLYLNASHKLPIGRWVNVFAEVRGNGAGFPDVRATVGSITFSPFLSRILIDAGRSTARAFGAEIPRLRNLCSNLPSRTSSWWRALRLPTPEQCLMGSWGSTTH